MSWSTFFGGLLFLSAIFLQLGTISGVLLLTAGVLLILAGAVVVLDVNGVAMELGVRQDRQIERITRNRGSKHWVNERVSGRFVGLIFLMVGLFSGFLGVAVMVGFLVLQR